MFAPRSLEEIKEDIRSRIGRRTPFALADREESEKVLAELKGVEAETWAEAWMGVGARWESTAGEREAKDQHQSAKEAYIF